jgi:Fic/DOC family
MRNSAKKLGYSWLCERFDLAAMPHWHSSFGGSLRRVEERDRSVRETYPKQMVPEENVFAHLEFALSYDGLNLAILAACFGKIEAHELEAHLAAKPLASERRRLWWCYESLVGKTLNLPDLATGNYIDLVSAEEYYVGPIRRSRRHRVNVNLLGNLEFCPMVRKTEKIRAFEALALDQKAKVLLASYEPFIRERASRYLFAKETKSSYAIEHESPDTARTERFMGLLARAGLGAPPEKLMLIDLQNAIVDRRWAENDYRHTQNYVGQTMGLHREIVHYVSPKPADVASLMEGLVSFMAAHAAGDVPPVVVAAVAAFGFVFIHPFEDGNGRLHRYLIHDILVRRGFTPHDAILPVSAVMLGDPAGYDGVLETFSEPLSSLVTYHLDEQGVMRVEGDTRNFYRFWDATRFVEYLYETLKTCIERDLADELRFLAGFDRAKRSVQAHVDMPDRLITLFIKLVRGNNGRLSASKREKFSLLSDEEVGRLEEAVRNAFGDDGQEAAGA